jgi:hypothetical protein
VPHISGSGSELVRMVDCRFRKPEMLRWVGLAGIVYNLSIRAVSEFNNGGNRNAHRDRPNGRFCMQVTSR